MNVIALCALLLLVLAGCRDSDPAGDCITLVGELPDLVAVDVKPIGEVWLVASGSRLVLVDPVDGGGGVLDELALDGNCRRLAVEDSCAVAVMGISGVQLAALTPAGTLAALGYIGGPTNAVDADIHHDLVAIADANLCIWLMDIADPTQPQVIHQIQLYDGSFPDYYQAVEIEGELLYILSSAHGLSIYSIHDPAAPHPLGTVDVHANDIIVRGGWAYLPGSEIGGRVLRALDVRDPRTPRQAGYIFTSPVSILHLWPEGDHLYATGVEGSPGAWSLLSYDIADPATPRWLESVELPSQPVGLGASGERVMVACVSRGVRCYAATCD